MIKSVVLFCFIVFFSRIVAVSICSKYVNGVLVEATSLQEMQLWWMFFGAFMTLYMLPTFIAFIRHHHNRFAIMMFNIICGATGALWVAALVYSFTNPKYNVT